MLRIYLNRQEHNSSLLLAAGNTTNPRKTITDWASLKSIKLILNIQHRAQIRRLVSIRAKYVNEVPTPLDFTKAMDFVGSSQIGDMVKMFPVADFIAMSVLA